MTKICVLAGSYQEYVNWIEKQHLNGIFDGDAETFYARDRNTVLGTDFDEIVTLDGFWIREDCVQIHSSVLSRVGREVRRVSYQRSNVTPPKDRWTAFAAGLVVCGISGVLMGGWWGATGMLMIYCMAIILMGIKK